MLGGCGPSAGSPDQAAQNFFDALMMADYDTAYALLSSASQDNLSRELKAMSSDEDSETAVTRLNAQLGTDFDQSAVAAVNSREFFRIAMASAVARDEKLRQMLAEQASVQPGGTDPEGATADVEVRFANGESRVVRCERQGGGWRVSFGPLTDANQ